jgi:predicted NBD/HSP70 family sugar kinase
MNYYAALDASLRSVHLCVVDEDGEIQAEAQVDSEADAIDTFLRKLQLEITLVGLEAGTLT